MDATSRAALDTLIETEIPTRRSALFVMQQSQSADTGRNPHPAGRAAILPAAE